MTQNKAVVAIIGMVVIIGSFLTYSVYQRGGFFGSPLPDDIAEENEIGDTEDDRDDEDFRDNDNDDNDIDDPIACTADAKICPDGTGVGRVGPNCEFAPCPITINGILSGTVSVGPLCPLKTDPPQPGCEPTAETYAVRPINIFKEDKVTLIKTFSANAEGEFNFELPIGKYYVELQNEGFGNSSNLPETIEIKEGKTTTLNIDIDTGIR